MKRYLPPTLLGFLATAFQVLLIREFAVYFYGNETTIGFVLAAWLLWGGVGSLAASRLRLGPSSFVPILYIVPCFFFLCLAGLRLSRFPLGLLPGEIVGPSLMLPFALACALLIGFPLGLLFVAAVWRDGGNVSRVYVGESLGAALGGLVVSLLIIPNFSNWQAGSLVAVAVSLLALGAQPRPRTGLAAAAVIVLAAAFWLADVPSERLYWRPFTLLESRDSRFGKLHVIKVKEQVSLYSDNVPVYASSDTASAEETVHFAFLQNPSASKALLIGGSAGGLAQALKYPSVRIDYVELDPDLVRLARRHLPRDERRVFLDPRIRLVFQDGRAFLSRAQGPYDIIIVSLPEPANAQVNRFYTREFFQLAGRKLTAGGVFSFKVPSSENYIGPERGRFLATLYHTLKGTFPQVAVVPGDTNIFLASRAPLSLDADRLGQGVKRLNLRNEYVRSELLLDRLDPSRIARLKARISTPRPGLNSDLVPVSYFYDSVLWNSQFRTFETKVFNALAAVPAGWLLGAPLALALVFLLLMSARPRAALSPLVPVVLLGFTTIVAEVLIVLWFQTRFGFVYSRVSLLISTFMAGLLAGSWLSARRRTSSMNHLLFLQAAILVPLGLIQAILGIAIPQTAFFALLFGLGFISGDLFVTANRLFLRRKTNYGLGYGLDLLGSFLGALAVSSVLIPLAGLRAVAFFLILLNLAGVLFLWGRKVFSSS